ncbi:hypothetical protein, partial [Enterococcus casseliflavus]|uniref:hypothetical protein n=1 Tax=Enterococcus casseliflavus TaxID=37734 RepID=UPI00325BF765
NKEKKLSNSNIKLTRSLKNDRSNKDLLRTEINNATDPNVRLELTRMLLEIEKEEKKKKFIKWLSIISVLVIILLNLLYLGNKSFKEPTVEKITESTSTTSQQASNSDTSTSVVK